MSGEAYGIEPVGLTVARYARAGVLWPVVLVAGLAAWLLLWGYPWSAAKSQPAQVTTTSATAEPAPLTGGEPVTTGTLPDESAIGPPNAAQEADPLNGLKISSQSWRRGGLGSKALVTFTLRNANDYAVRDIAISCAFTRRDGSHLTDRTRTLPDTVNMKSKKTFARMHVGFVNVNASRAKCSLVTASRI
jgi:hypothetical protein